MMRRKWSCRRKITVLKKTFNRDLAEADRRPDIHQGPCPYYTEVKNSLWNARICRFSTQGAGEIRRGDRVFSLNLDYRGQIDHIFVLEPHRGKGLGGKIL
jgi:GNAT superfamily N-acetyltransferase